MGLRSWITKIESKKEWKSFEKSIKKNPLAYGIHYVISLEKAIPMLVPGIWVAWSGDCNSSLTEYMSRSCQNNTVFLDDIVDETPEFNEDPNKFGTLYSKEPEEGFPYGKPVKEVC